ncbi:MAG TPA: hypothetical protein VE422_00425 [Terriglobia bacterium]|nr:hypothetical protein [Terriglobia bacterium]
MFRFLYSPLLLFLCFFFTPSLLTASVLTALDPAFGRQGATITLTISGSDFDPVSELIPDDPGIIVTSVVAASSTQLRATIVWNASPGLHSVVVRGRSGDSNSARFEILPSLLQPALEFDDPAFAGPAGRMGAPDAVGLSAFVFAPSQISGSRDSVYFTDGLGIRRIDRSTNEVTTVPLLGSVPNGRLWSDGDRAYFAEVRSGAVTIREFLLRSGEISTLVSIATTRSDVTLAEALWGDSQNIYVTDAIAGKIHKVNRVTGQSTVLTDFGQSMVNFSSRFGPFSSFGKIWGNGTLLYITAGGTLVRISTETGERTTVLSQLPAGFSGLIWGSGSKLFLIGSDVVRAVDPVSNEISILAGTAGQLGWTDGVGGAAKLNFPVDVWGDDRFLFLAEAQNRTIRKIEISTQVVTTIAGSPPLVFAGGFGEAARLPFISGIWGDQNDLYLTMGEAIRRVSKRTGEVTTFLADNNPTVLIGLAGSLWGDGRFLYIGTEILRRLDLATKESSVIAGAARQFNCADGIGTEARFGEIGGMWGDGKNLFVNDTRCQTVRRVELSTGRVITLAGNPVSGQTGLIEPVDGTGPEARFVGLRGRIWGRGSELFVADAVSLRRVSISTGLVTTILARDLRLPSSTDGSLNEAGFCGVDSLWGDGSFLYFGDCHGLRRIRLSDLTASTLLVGNPRSVGLSDVPGFRLYDGSLRYLWGDGEYFFTADWLSNALRRLSPVFEPGVLPVSLPVQAARVLSAQAGPSLQITQARMRANLGSTAPSGVALFAYRQNGVLVSETAVPASPPIRSGRLNVLVDGPLNTGIAVSNPNDQAAILSFFFTDSLGRNFGYGSTRIPARSQLARFLTENPYNGIPITDATFTFASSVPVAAVAIRGFVNERGEFLMSTLPVVSVIASNEQPLIFPHVVNGGGWTTEIILINSTDGLLSGQVNLAMETGRAELLTYSIPARSSRSIKLDGSSPAVDAGSIVLIPSDSTKTPAGVAIFRFTQGGVTVSETGVLGMAAGSGFRMFVENGTDVQSGIALANVSDASSTVTLTLTRLDGMDTGLRSSLTLRQRAHVSFFLNQIPGFESLPASFQGVLRIASNTASVAVVGVRSRYNERGDFLVTAMPVADESAPPELERIFPHIVSGGGYTTQILIFNNSSTDSNKAMIRFRTQSGETVNPLLN